MDILPYSLFLREHLHFNLNQLSNNQGFSSITEFSDYSLITSYSDDEVDKDFSANLDDVDLYDIEFDETNYNSNNGDNLHKSSLSNDYSEENSIFTIDP